MAGCTHYNQKEMRRHTLLTVSLIMFSLGTLCQLYSMFSPEEPYIQQISFMLVSMPSVIGIVYHYYTMKREENN